MRVRLHSRAIPLIAVGLAIPALLSAAVPLTCAAGVLPRSIRYEGMTELIGDIVLSCTGGTPPASGTAISTVDITLSLNTSVTSRLLGTGATAGSEALLLLDEPGSGQPVTVAGFGPAAPQTFCSTLLGAVTGGCVEYARDAPVTGGTVQVAANASTGALNPGANVFQGVVSANQVTFHGVPILAPAAGSARGIRITNVRANAAGLPPGSALTASVTTSSPATVNAIAPLQVAVQPGLTATVRDAPNSVALAGLGAGFSACTGSTSPVPLAMLQFGENFGTAFATRVAATTTYSGQSATPVQNVPGSLYYSESGFVVPAASSGGVIAGLADYGTRLKASFNNIPAGVRIFVSVTNLATNTSSSDTPAPTGVNTSSYAALVQSESSADVNGFAPVTIPTTAVNGTATGLAELLVVNGSATAVWEVINTNPSVQETVQFGVWQQFTANGPPPGTATVNLSFAPTFTASAGSAASSVLPVVRFADTSSPFNLLSITACPTSCTYILSGNTAYPAGAAGGSVTVTASAGSSCAWAASSPVNWVVITAGSSGTGSGTVQFNVLANANAAARNAALTVAGQSFTVTQAGQAKTASTSTLAASASSAAPGQAVTLTATVSPLAATGTVTFNDGSAAIGTLTLNNGIASLTTSILAAGSHSLTAVYSGDSVYNGSTSAVVAVSVAAGHGVTSIGLAALPNPASAGQPVTLNAVVLPTSATGSITFRDGPVTLSTVAMANGAAALTTSILAVGSHTLTASYSGDSNNGASTSAPVTEVINPAGSQVTVSLSVIPSPAAAGQIVTLIATIAPAGATGTVTFKDGSTALNTAALTGGPVSFSTSTLTVGSHTLTASYSGDSNNGASTSAPVTEVINPAGSQVTVSLSVIPSPAAAGQIVTLIATIAPAGATGTVTFKDGSTALNTAALTGGPVSFSTTTLAAGTHTLTASYSGDSTYGASTSSAATEVINGPTSPTVTTLFTSPNPAAGGQPVTLTATVTPISAAGAVTFKDGTVTLGTVTLNNGSASLTTSTLTAGSHSLTVLYNGNAAYSSSTSVAITEVVNAPNATVTLSALPNPATFGQTVTLTLVVSPPSATGTVSVLDSSTGISLGSATLTSGSATITASALKGGSHSLEATYNGDTNNAAGNSALVTEIVNPAATTTTLSVASASSSVGQAVVLTATVTPSGSTGAVVFKDGSITLGNSTLAGGTATFSTATLTTGTHTLSASYSGDGNYAVSTSSSVIETVASAPACVAFPVGYVPFTSAANVSQPDAAGDLAVVGSMSPANYTTYQSLPLPAALNQQFCGTVLLAPGVSVTAYVPSAAERTGNFSPFAGLLVDPQASGAAFAGGIIPTSRIPGTFAWRILALLQTSTTTLSVTPSPATPGQAVTLTAAVTPSSATGTVTFLDGSTTLGIATVNGGIATLATATLTAGSHALSASYGGDSRNGSSVSSPVTESVGLPPTTTTLSVTPATSTSGQIVTLTATVSPSSATGTVTFQDGSTSLGTAALGAGTATFTITTLATGSHSLTAAYGGDLKDGASVSVPVTGTVGLSTSTTSLSVTPATTTIGASVTLAATVTPPSASGSIAFMDGSSILQTVALNAGLAIFTTSTLTAGSHLLTASYSGDAKNGPSTSNQFAESVTKQTSTTLLSVSSTTPSTGQALTLTASVTPSSATGSVSFLDSQATLGTVTLSGGVAVFTTSALTVGSHALSASYSGDSRNVASKSPSIDETVGSGSPLQITSPTTPVALFVSQPWSQTFNATGGIPPYTWTLPANTSPDLALTAIADTAVLSGTPSTPGSYQLTVRLQDSSSQSFQAPLTLTVNPLPVVTVSAPQPATPADQPAPQLSLAQAYPFALTGTFTLAFAPNAPGLPAGYNDAQFSDGTTTFHITIPANSTTPNPPIPAIQLGSVAGDIIGTLGPLTISGGVQSVSFAGAPPSIKITVPVLPPIIVPGSVKIVNVTSTGFQVFLDASSTTRDLTSGTFVFTAASGTQMSGCTPNCTVSFGPDSAAWFASAAGVSNGGATSLTIPFTFNGDTSVIGTVAVTLTNSVGTSAPVSGGR